MVSKVQAFFIKLLIGLLIFLAPVQDSIRAVFFLVFIDLAFGLIAAKKRGERILSSKLAHTPLKLLVYFATIVAVYAADTQIGLGVPATKIVTGIIGATEVLSLLEKAEALTGAPIFQKLREMLKPSKPKPPEKGDGS